MSLHRTAIGVCLAAILSLVLVSSASAGPAGDEYLPKIPAAGAGASSGKGAQDDSSDQAGPPISNSGGSGGDSSGSVLLNPIVLLVIVAMIAAVVGVTLRRRRGEDAEGEGTAQETEPVRQGRGGPRTPDGEIIGPDKAS